MSLDVLPATVYVPDVQQPIDFTTRRSLSIFSRKGAETPKPFVQPLGEVSVPPLPAIAVPAAPKTLKTKGSLASLKPRRWKVRKSSEPRILEGTVLRAVPKNGPMLHPLAEPDRELPVSPNAEILRNIGLSPESTKPAEMERSASEPSKPISPVDSANSLPLTRHAYSRSSSSVSLSRKPTMRAGDQVPDGDIIGVWKNGKTRWERQTPRGSRNSSAEPANRIARPKSVEHIDELKPSDIQRKPSRPSIKVVIPDSQTTKSALPFVPFVSTNHSAIEPAEMERVSFAVTGKIANEAYAPIARQSGRSTEAASDNSSEIFAVSSHAITYAPKPKRITPRPLPLRIPSKLQRKVYQEQEAESPTLGAEGKSPVSSRCSTPELEDDTSQNSCRTSITSISSKQGSDKPPAVPPKDDNIRSLNLRKASQQTLMPAVYDATNSVQIDTGFGSPEHPAELEGTSCGEVPHMSDIVAVIRTPSIERPRIRLSSRRGNSLLQRMDRKGTKTSKGPAKLSPRWSIATPDHVQHALDAHLAMVLELDSESGLDTSSERTGSETSFRESLPPPPPPKSARRYKLVPSRQGSKRARQSRAGKPLSPGKKSSLRKRVRPTISIPEPESPLKISAKAAEDILLNVMERLDSFEDLQNAALVNHAFHTVYNRNRSRLIQKVLFNQCPPAWEYLETCIMERQRSERDIIPMPVNFDSQKYLEMYMHGAYIITETKTLILQQCRTFLRYETVTSMESKSKSETSRTDSALWRIWTFCKLFGSNRGREDDFTAQMDWLRGGVLAHQGTCSSNISVHDSFYLSSVLLNAPEHFAKGNQNGLSPEELYDMTEMWNCLRHITQAVIGQTELARQYGVYDNTDVRGGDVDGEEAALEEWHHFVLTLGLNDILAFAKKCTTSPSAAFVMAYEHGWMNWQPPMHRGCRAMFLKEALTRLYDERVCETFAPAEAQAAHMRKLRRRRGASLAADIQRRRLNTASTHSKRALGDSEPTIEDRSPVEIHAYAPVEAPAYPSQPQRPSPPAPPTCAAPSPPSTISRSNSGLSHRSLIFTPLSATGGSIQPQPSRHASSASSQARPTLPTSQHIQPALRGGFIAQPRPLSMIPAPPAFQSPPPASPPPYYHGRHASMQHPLQMEMARDRELNGARPTSMDKAIFRIVEMGFSPEQARGALKVMDMGDGLRIDRAVEYLLRQEPGGY